MATDYATRLKIPLIGNDETIFSFNEGFNRDERYHLKHLATGYTRIVIGGRGPYIEFADKHIVHSSFIKTLDEHYYYDEYRSIVGNVKLYHQIHRVDYADYVEGMYYISPFEVLADALIIIKPLERKKKQ